MKKLLLILNKNKTMKKILFILLCLPLLTLAQFTDNFSDGDFTNNPNWMGDVGSFQVDTNNKLHLNDTITSSSSLVTQSQAIINGVWIFNVRLDFSPSNNNYARVYLVSDMIDLSGSLNGMYVKIGGQTGGVDDISLYTQSGTNHNEIIDGIAGLVSNNPDIRVKATRDAIGNWELFLDTAGVFFTQGTAFDNSITSSDYFGVYCKYTVTRSDKFWFDDFNVSGSAIILPTTYVPDDNFENYLEANGMGNNIPNDSNVFTSAIDTVTFLDVNSQNISDLTGIEAFTALTSLDCQSNQLTSLDVNTNTALTDLDCLGNQLISLGVSNNTALERLYCGDNQLTTLDVSNNTALIQLWCDWNQLISLDVSNNTALTLLGCGGNQLTSLDVSNNTALTKLYCGFNPLGTLDVSQNTFLTLLNCAVNQLTALDVSNNIDLEYLSCGNNQLTSLDVSNNTALTLLGCSGNQLTSIDLRNGNNIFLDTNFSCIANPNLFCIDVDDPTWSTANWSNIDPQHYFSNNCSGTAIQEHTTNKELLRTIDVLGRETKNNPLFYIYDDGTVEKRITIE